MRLRSHLILLVAAAVVPLLIFSFVILHRHFELQHKERLQALLDTTRALSLAVDREVGAARAILEGLARSPYLQAGDIKTFYEECLTFTTEISWIVLTQLNGQQALNTLKPFGVRLPRSGFPDVVRYVAETKKPVVSDLFVGAASQRPIVAVAVPVFRKGEVIYVLDMAFVPERVTELLLAQRLPEGYFGGVLDRKGILLARTLNAENLVGRPATQELTSQMAEAHEGWGAGRSHEGVPLYQAFTRSDLTGWTTAVGVAQAAVDGSVKQSARSLAGGGLILLLFGFAVALLLGKRIADPLMALARSSENIQRGGAIEVKRSEVSEVKELHDALLAAGSAAREGALERERRLVAEARQAEAEAAKVELSRREELYLTLVENLPDTIFRLDKKLRHLYISRSVKKATGWPAEHFVGKTGLEAGLPEEIWRPFQTKCSRVLRTGKPESLEFAHQSPEGLRYYQSRIIPEYGSDSSVESLLGITSDITEHKFEEETLVRRSAQVSEILEKSSAIVFVKDLEGKYIYVNRQYQAMFGDVRGRTDFEVFSPSIAETLRSNDMQVLTSREAVTFEERAPRADGEHVYLATKFSLSDSHGRAYAVCGISVDITDRKRSEKALQDADRRKDEFLAMLGHELRNPIGVISTAVQLLRRLQPPPAENVQMIREMIERQVLHTSRLLDDLLDVSRVSQGKIQLHKQGWDLRDIVRQTGADYRSLLDEKGLDLKTILPEHALPILGDRTRLAQVLGNLLHNACKFSEIGSIITLKAEKHESGKAIIMVQDSGVGIEPEMLQWIFEPFSQADHSLDRSRGGLGLGLALVSGVVRLHGGRASAASEGVGRGATFTIELPLEQGGSQGVAPVIPQEHVPRFYRVLVIEDNPVAARNMRSLLELSGHTVESAHSGPAGVAAARTFGPELVLCDIGLPGLDGYGVAKALRQQIGLKEAHLIAVSGYAQDERRAREAGFNAHILKPLDFEKLEALVVKLTRERGDSLG